MPAINQPLYVEQGATFVLAFTWCQEGPVVDGAVTAGAPYDLTSCIARMQIRRRQGDPALVTATSLSTGAGADRIVIDGPNGRVVVTLTAEDTDLLIHKSNVYDLEIEWPLQAGEIAPRVDRLLQGSVTVDPNVTQDPADPVVDNL